MTMLLLFSILAALVASGSVLGAAYVMSREARLELERHVNLVAVASGKRESRSPQSDSTSVKAAGEALRNLLLTGIKFRWGVHSSASVLLVVAAVSLAAAWLLLHFLLSFSNWIAVPVALAAGFAGPNILLRREQAKSAARFLDAFPGAVDMIVRMLRAGLPIAATIRAVGREAGVPVDSVFKTIADKIEIGIPFEEALTTASDQVGLADFRFFTVAVALQRATGGNLAVTLDILCDIIRKRRGVRLKAKAATGEVRLSAYVLGAIPFFVIGALTLVAPNYLTPLIRDPRGHIIIAIALSLLLLAFLVMRSMMKSATQL
jgi:tight adherence protein B